MDMLNEGECLMTEGFGESNTIEVQNYEGTVDDVEPLCMEVTSEEQHVSATAHFMNLSVTDAKYPIRFNCPRTINQSPAITIQHA
ncbi:hypothetical protein GDO78_020658 [Eleutherodactylus coqui]|uniref:Uncharacterized protein n=1 Tax=Eleutherodactylus coqui TaxID=57060 RepID=A0A8J6E5P3_ELECQ|nr:hypothetical protein GDO78_020658 [Eleutherodactylus coqui]